MTNPAVDLNHQKWPR